VEQSGVVLGSGASVFLRSRGTLNLARALPTSLLAFLRPKSHENNK